MLPEQNLSLLFFKKATPLAAALLATNMAFAHDDHSHNEQHDDPQVNFNPAAICDTIEDLHTARSECYGIYAENMRRYAENASAPYLQAETLEELRLLLEHDNPTRIETDEAKATIRAIWYRDGEDGERLLHRQGGPAFIKVELGRSYMEMYLQRGTFYREDNLPTTTTLRAGKDIRVTWQNEAGLHNMIGPAKALNDEIENMLHLDWAVNDILQNPLDDENGPVTRPSSAIINLDSNVAVFQRFASGDNMEGQWMHRHDCVFNIERDGETGIVTKVVYHYHDLDPETPDEIVKEVTNDPQTGEQTGTRWLDGFSETEAPDNFTLPASHYCQDPAHAHPAATPVPAPERR